MLWLVKRIRAYWFTPTDCVDLAVCRIVFYGALLIFYFRSDYSWYAEIPDIFWHPPGLLKCFSLSVASPGYLGAFPWIWKASLLLAALGVATRLSTWIAFLLGGYLIGVTHCFGLTCHYDAMHVLLMGVMALSRCGDAISVDSMLRQRVFRRPQRLEIPVSPEYRWPICLACVLMAIMYFNAGFAKLRVSGFHWFTSDYLAHLLVWHQYQDPPTTWGLYLARMPLLCNILAFGSVVIELSVPLALVSRRWRLFLLPAAYCLHVAIYLLIGPQFLRLIICYVFWIPWKYILSAIVNAGSVSDCPPSGAGLEVAPLTLARSASEPLH
jgi:hypothetical protein